VVVAAALAAAANVFPASAGDTFLLSDMRAEVLLRRAFFFVYWRS
jgi:hypothetical protein